MIKVVRTIDDMAKVLESGAVCYISGPITGVEDYRERFMEAEQHLKEGGLIPINPAYMPEGLKYDDYFPTCYAQVDVSSVLCFLQGYEASTGAAREAKRAKQNKKEYWAFTPPQFVGYWMYYRLQHPDDYDDLRGMSKEDIDGKKKVWIETLAKEGQALGEWIERVNPPKTEKEKQNDKVKQFLRSYLYCQNQIDAACDEILKLDSRRKRITVLYREVHGGGGSDYTEAVIDNITELEDSIVAMTKQLQSERVKVQFWIDALEDFREREVLTLCYINDMQFEAIGKKLNYSLDHVKRIHRNGINKLRELLQEKLAQK